MKKTVLCGMLSFLCSFALFFSLLYGSLPDAKAGTLRWEHEIAARDMGDYTSLALDSSGNPHISCYQSVYGRMKHVFSNSGGWQMETVADAAYSGIYSSLALDGAGMLHISYYRSYSKDYFSGNGGCLMYAYKDGTGWVQETVDDAVYAAGKYSSLALDKDGKPHISYYDETNEDLKYAFKDSGGWVKETVDGNGDENVGEFTSIALDPVTGSPRISYYDWTNNRLKYAAKSPDGWAVEVVDDSADVGYWSSLALDSGGSPCISYYDWSNKNLKYAYKSGGEWVNETVDDDGEVGRYTSLALDSSDRPFISYHDATNSDLKYAAQNGSAWDIGVVDNDEADLGYHTSLALDSRNRPCISYYEEGVGRDNLRFATSYGNSGPVLNSIGPKSVDEGETLQFEIKATDPDGDSLEFSAGSLPVGAAFDAASRTFSWTPGYDQAGIYSVHFAVYDGDMTDSEDVTITVNNVNTAPVLDTIGDKAVSASQLIQFTLRANDQDGDVLTYSAGPLPAGATFNEADGTFSWTPGDDQVGTYEVSFTVSDKSLTASEVITITVHQVNGAPVLSPIGSKTVNEGESLTFTLSAIDPDGDELRYSVKDLPVGAAFDAASGIFSWTPDYDQGGTYSVSFAVNDGSLTDSEVITITVNNINRAPVLEPIGHKAINVRGTLQFTLQAADPDGDTLEFSAGGLPAGATFDEANGTFSWTPNDDQGGRSYDVYFAVNDGSLTAREDITITVNKRPDDNTIDIIVGNKTVNEGELLLFTVNADPKSDDLEFSASDLPPGATFSRSSRTFRWTPDYDQAGVYIVHFAVSNGSLTASKDITITVNNVNRAPKFEPIDNKKIGVKETLQFTLQAADPDGDALTYAVGSLPPGAFFDAASRVFVWKPGNDQTGTYSVRFEVSDGSLTDRVDVTITVSGGSSGGGGGGGGVTVTVDKTAPTVSSTDPANNAANVPVDTSIKITFNENLEKGANFGTISFKDDKGVFVGITASISTSDLKQLIISPQSRLSDGTVYTVVIPAAGVKDKAGNSLQREYSFEFTTAATVVSAPAAAGKTNAGFSDMKEHWASVSAGKLASLGIMNGYPDGTFRPEQELTRVEAAVILARVMNLTPLTADDLSFDDASTIPAWAVGPVAAIVREGMIYGYPQPGGGFSFGAGVPVSRAELVSMAARIMQKNGEQVVPQELKFADNGNIPDWAVNDIGLALAKGIVSGYGDNTFRPDKVITRAEAATIISNLINAIDGK